MGARIKAMIKAIRRAKLQADDKRSVQATESKPGSTGIPKKPCQKYQTNECTERAAHSDDDVTWLHCCATCWRVKLQKYSHSKLDCNRNKALADKSTGSKT